MQWKNEIETHTDGNKVLVWHGASRETDVDELKKYDVVSALHLSTLSSITRLKVLTTYAVLERFAALRLISVP